MPDTVASYSSTAQPIPKLMTTGHIGYTTASAGRGLSESGHGCATHPWTIQLTPPTHFPLDRAYAPRASDRCRAVGIHERIADTPAVGTTDWKGDTTLESCMLHTIPQHPRAFRERDDRIVDCMVPTHRGRTMVPPVHSTSDENERRRSRCGYTYCESSVSSSD